MSMPYVSIDTIWAFSRKIYLRIYTDDSNDTTALVCPLPHLVEHLWRKTFHEIKKNISSRTSWIRVVSTCLCWGLSCHDLSTNDTYVALFIKPSVSISKTTLFSQRVNCGSIPQLYLNCMSIKKSMEMKKTTTTKNKTKTSSTFKT